MKVGSRSATVTFVLTDIVGSTQLWEHEPAAMGAAMLVHDAIVDAAVTGNAGTVVRPRGEGDSRFAVFDRTTDAVLAAATIVSGLQTVAWETSEPIQVRVGVHTGEVESRDGDFYGTAVNLCARLRGIGHPGQVLLSETSARLVEAVPPDGVSLRDVGVHRLKGFRNPERVFQLRHPQLDDSFPPLVSEVRRHNLPVSLNRFIGRTEELVSVTKLVGECRLVTLTGTGGVGKTRLALEVAGSLVEVYDGRVWLVELAQVVDPSALVPIICNALSIPPQPNLSPLESLMDGLTDRPIMIVFDNCEHLIAEITEIVSAVLRACPELRVLVTSREPLGIAGEHVHRVASLDQEQGAELFIEQLLAADQSMLLDADQRVIVGEICRRVDGIPLAIQLAAARARSMSLNDILDRLADRFRLLRGGARANGDRHQTLQATVTWSYQLLSPEEQLAFERMSVFAGDFDLAAAEHLCSGHGLDPADVLDLVQGLVDKSMVIARHHGSTTRYRLLETLRQYGENRLDERGSLAAIRDRHADWYVRVARNADRTVRGSGEVEAIAVFDAEWDNLRAAHSWALSSEHLDTAVDLCTSCHWYAAIGRMRWEHAEWVHQTLAAVGDHHPGSIRLYGQGGMWHGDLLGDEELGRRLARRGIELADAPDDPSTVACWAALAGASVANTAEPDASEWAFRGLCSAVDRLDDPDHDWFWLLCVVDSCFWAHPELVDAWFDRVRAMSRRVDSPSLEAWVDHFHGVLRLVADSPDFEDARAYLARALDRARSIGAVSLAAACLRALAIVSCGVGEPGAVARCVEALDELFRLRYWQKAYQTLESTALALAVGGHRDDAAVILGFLENEVGQGFGMEIDLGFRRRATELVTGTPYRAQMIARGSTMTRGQIATFVLTETTASIAV